MENKLSTETNKSSKALFLLCLFPVSSLISAIVAELHYHGYAFYWIKEYFIYPFGNFLIFLSFLFIHKKRKYALSFAAFSTAVQILQIIMHVIEMDYWRISFYYLTDFIRALVPLFLSILLIIYCVSPSTSRCYLFAGLICCVFFIINLSSILQDISPMDNVKQLFFIFGFLANSDVATQVMKPKPKKKDVSAVLDMLDKFAQLKEQGILTEEEFEAKKQELMSQM